ncbi:MAG: hypothetical protein AAFX00_14400, partial [Pseudomonadota bacterium]
SARAFEQYFRRNPTGAVVFNNLGKDARLIVPSPVEPQHSCHLATFVRNAPQGLVHDVLIATGKEGLRRIGRKPFWLNTAGDGVPWLHIRLDDHPKYYRHAPYRTKS